MLIKKGTSLKVYHSRRGLFLGVATKDFDTKKEEWFPITSKGKEVPCRASLCTLEKKESL